MINISAVDKVLNNLLSITDQSLLNAQISHCPHWADLKLTRILDGHYYHRDSPFISVDTVFRVDDKEWLRNRFNPQSYKGPLRKVIEDKYIDGMAIFVNGRYIEIDNITLIMDARYTYLEIKDIGDISTVYGGDSQATLDGIVTYNLPPVGDGHKEVMILKVTSDNPTSFIAKINGNIVEVNKVLPSDIFNANAGNILELSCTQSKIGKIEFVSTQPGAVLDFDVKVILFPSGCEIKKVSSRTYTPSDSDFIFQSGLYVSKSQFTSSALSIIAEVISPIIPFEDVEVINIDSDRWIEIDKPEYKVFPQTLFSFSGGLLNTITSNGGNLYDGTTPSSNKAFRRYSNKNRHNVSDFAKLNTAIEKLKDSNWQSLLSNIYDPLDFVFDQNTLQIDRIRDILGKVILHNSQLMNEYVENFSTITQQSFTGSEIKALSSIEDSKYKYRMFRRLFHIPGEREIIVFKNGFLYPQENISKAGFYLVISFDTILDSDTIDFLIFERVNNNLAPFTIDENDKIKTIGNYIPFEDLMIQTHDIDYHIYNHIPRDPKLQYEITDKLTDIGKGEVQVELNDYYYRRELNFSSRRKFIHHRYTIDGNEMMIEQLYKILLPDEFRYCTNRNQFLIFWNNRKVDNSDSLVCLNHPSLPFDKRFIHINKKCQIGDILDIYYIPVEMREVFWKEEVSEHGYIDLFKDELGYAFNNKNCSVFMNGKRLSQHHSTTLGGKSGRVIVDPGSRYNLSVLQHIDYNDEAFDLMRSLRDAWTIMIQQISDEDRDELFGFNLLLTNTDGNMRDGSYYKWQVVYEVIRRYWWVTEHKVKVENPVFYAYDYNGLLVLPIDSSKTMINVPKLLDAHGENKTIYIDTLGNQSCPIDAEELYFTYDNINIVNYQYYNDTTTIMPSILDGSLVTEDGTRVLDILIAHADASMILTWDGTQYLPIDAGRIYEILTDLNIGKESIGYIDASIIRPYFFEKSVTMGNDIIRPIPVDSSLEHIRPLPELIVDL